MSEQVKLPKIRLAVGKSDCHVLWPYELATPFKRAGYVIVDYVPAAQRDSEWRSGLLGDEAIRAASERFLPAGTTSHFLLRERVENEVYSHVEAVIEAGAPDGGRE